MNELQNHYQILDLKPGALLEEVKSSYRELVKVWHPDRFAHDPKLQHKAQEKLKQINCAYETICNGFKEDLHEKSTNFYRSSSFNQQSKPPESPQTIVGALLRDYLKEDMRNFSSQRNWQEQITFALQEWPDLEVQVINNFIERFQKESVGKYFKDVASNFKGLLGGTRNCEEYARLISLKMLYDDDAFFSKHFAIHRAEALGRLKLLLPRSR